MDARPRTAVFIVNGNVCHTFVSGLPPSIRFGLSMKHKGVSVRFDGLTRLKKATPLPRVNEIKWNPEDLKDSEDMYMNGIRSSVLTIQTQMPSLVFTDASHFTVDDNTVASACLPVTRSYESDHPKWSSFVLSEQITEGIVAISFTFLTRNDMYLSYFGLIGGMSPIPEIGQRLGQFNDSIALSRERKLHLLTSVGQQEIDLSSFFESGDHVVVEINMDSTPRTAQFFVDGQSANAVVDDLPESVRVGFSTWDQHLRVRIDRITNLNRSIPFTDKMKVVEWPRTRPLQATETDETENLSKTIGDKVDDGTSVEKKKRQIPAIKLPELLFTHKSHFTIRNNILTRTEKGTDENGGTRPSTVLFSEPITKGVVSVTFVVLTLAELMDQKGFISFGLLDSSRTVPQLGQVLGKDVKSRVVMEVNMDSTPRTVQFFVNGKAIKRYVSEIPESVRIGFSADVMGTSVQITSLFHSTQATPLTDKMREIKWTFTEQSLEERKFEDYATIRREAEGSMPALLFRNPEHFKIEGNLITRTDVDFNGLPAPFSTVMIDEVLAKTRYVAITILALPQTENSRGIVMFGGLWDDRHIPKSPKALGIRKKRSFAFCSLDGTMFYNSPDHPRRPLQVGDQVVLQVTIGFFGEEADFFVNGEYARAGTMNFDSN
ncbi:hypothetical protein BLNAU_10187 [Blattamonas nauphoetae]|uniref:SPRY domain-containing protein n=1 Tax=Blattamonas nauphoetae TaxID=2049346 RepID=A0ABQ9XTQ6_9EUKA|nr:hypothetical protein BLNAU_10187 [Blattamonas nauphoetae]